MIQIYDKDDRTIKAIPVTKDCIHEEELMKSNFVRLSWSDRDCYDLPVGAYIWMNVDGTPVLDGNTENAIKYRLFDPYTPKADRHRKYTYTPEFQHPVMWLGRIPFMRVANKFEDDEPIPWNEADPDFDWTYSGYADEIAGELVSYINWLSAVYPFFGEVFGSGWTAKPSPTLNATANCSFPSIDILSAASELASKYECEFHFDWVNKIFYLGKWAHGDFPTVTPLLLTSGVNVGVPSVSHSKEDYHNAFTVQGSTRNLSKKSASGDNVQVTERLKLNEQNYPDSTIYVDNEGAEITKADFLNSGLPMLSKSLIFDDVYPKLDLYVYDTYERICWLLDSEGNKVEDDQDNPAPSSVQYDNRWCKTYSKWYLRLAYYDTDSANSIGSFVKDGVTNYWHQYKIKDDVYADITDKAVIVDNHIVDTDLPFNSNAFTTPNEGTSSYKVYISVKRSGTQVYEGEVLVTNNLGKAEFLFDASSYGTVAVGDKVYFLEGVDSRYINDDHKESILIKDKVLSIAFQPNYDYSEYTSPLAGYEFELVYFKHETREYKSTEDITPQGHTAQEGDFRIVQQEGDRIIPTTSFEGLFPKGGATPSRANNKATLFNIAVDDTWKSQAQADLKASALGEIARLFTDLNTYTFNSDPIKFRRTDTNLNVGQLVTWNDGNSLIGGTSYELDTHVRKLTTRLDHPKVITITVGNEKTKGNISTMKEQIETLIISGYGSGGGGGMTEAQFNQLLKNYGYQYFLSKTSDDSTPYHLGVGSLSVNRDATIGGNALVSGNGQVTGDLDVNGDTKLNGNVQIGNSASDTAIIEAIAKIYQQIKSDNYNGDSPFDQGWMIKNADVNHGNASYMVIDNLFVRMKAIFTELEIRKISYAGGNIILSHAGSTLVKVVPLTSTMQPTVVDGKLTISGNLARVENGRVILDNGTISGNRIILDGSQEILYAYRCYIKKDDGTTATENWWREDDQARCQTFNIDETGTYHDVSNSFYWRRVMNVGSEVPIGETTDEVMDYVDLSALDCITGSTVPQEGDVIVQMGNRTDVSRQGFISLEVYGDDAPAFKVYKYVNSYTLNGKMPIIISPKNTSMKVQHYEIETDYGTFPAVKERGDWSLIPEHKCHYYDIVQHNGSTWLCIFPQEGSGGVDYTTEEPSLEATYWKIYAQAGKDGSDGKSFNILGSYDTMEELIAAHPTGSVGDAYIVSGDLIVWDDENQQWANSGRIQGETGNGISGATIHYGTSSSNTIVPTNWTANYADLPYTQGEWIWTRVVLSYTDGTSANPYYTQARIGLDGSYKSTAFTRSNKQLSATTPTGGDYSNPLPNQQIIQGEVITWADGIPSGESIVWATSRIFTPTGASTGWSTPRQMTDTTTDDVEFSANETKPANPSDNESERDAQGWRDVTRNPSFDFTTAIWKAERRKRNGVWSAWVIEKIKGESITKSSEDVKYALSDSGTVTPQSGWQTTKPTSTDTKRWIWTRTIITWSDTSETTLYQAERDPNDGVDGMEIVVGTQTIKYAVTTNGSTHPAEDSPLWQDTYTPEQGKWLWSKITTPYLYSDGTSAGQTVSYNVSYTANDGRGISRVDEYYLAGTSATIAPTGTWVTNPNNAGWSATNKYLWNYENVVYTDGTQEPTTKGVVAIWSKDGKGIDSIVNYYKASSNPNEQRPAVDGTDGWTTTIQAISPEAVYLHNYEKITYTDNSTPYRSDAHIIGHWGMDALEASQLILSPSVVSIPTDTDGVVLEDFRKEIEVSMKTYSNLLALIDVDFTENDNVVVEASTLIAMSWSGASVSNNRLVNVGGSVNNGRLTISADDYAVTPTKIVVKATKGNTLTERTVSISATALDEDGNEYNGYNELTVQRQYVAEDGVDGEDAINVVLSPFAVLFSQDVSSGDDTAAHSIAQITPETITSQVLVTKGETPITTGVIVTVSGTSHYNASGVTIDGTTITLDKDGIQVEEVDAKYYPYDNGYVDLNVAYNGENYPLRLQFYVNLMGKFKTTIEGDVETSVATKIIHEVDPTSQVTDISQVGVYIRSSNENIARLDEEVNDPTTGLEHRYSEISQNVSKISLKVGQYYNLFYNAFFSELLAERTPYSATTNIVLASEGTYGGKAIRMGGGYFSGNITSSIMGSDTMGYGVYLDKGTYTFQMYARVTNTYTSEGFAGVELVWDDNADFSTWSSSKIINRIKVTGTSYTRYTYTFTLSSACYVGFRMMLDGITIGGTSFNLCIDAVMLELGSTASSMVSSYGGNQAGAQVGKVQRSLLATGIDIEQRKITMTADQFECQNNSGVKTAWLDDMGNFTVRGVYNNLITVINQNNWDKYIIKIGSGRDAKFYLDVLLCGSFVVIDYLPISDFNAADDGVLRLPYYANDNYYTRGYTRYLDKSDSTPRLMTADELRMLAGRKMIVKWNAFEGISNNRAIGDVFRPNIYYGTSNPTVSHLDNRLRDLYGGERYCISINPSDTSVNRSPSLYVPKTFFMSFELVKFHTNQSSSDYSWGYIWMADEDAGSAAQDDINWT